jgi:hypothetical protein
MHMLKILLEFACSIAYNLLSAPTPTASSISDTNEGSEKALFCIPT